MRIGRVIRTFGLGLVVVLSSVARADDVKIAPPRPVLFVDSRGEYAFKTIPSNAPLGRCKGVLFTLDKDGNEEVAWRTELVNVPGHATVTRGGLHVITLGSWYGGVGGDGHSLVVYGEKGKVVADFKLEDLFTEKEIERLHLRTSALRSRMFWSDRDVTELEADSHGASELVIRVKDEEDKKWSKVIRISLKTGKLANKVADDQRESGGEIEARLLRALRERDPKGVQKVATEFAALDGAARRALAVRVRDGAVEFRFAGEFPGAQNDDGSGTGKVEFVLSEPGRSGAPGSPCYESLCLLNEADLERLEAVWNAVMRVTEADKTPPVEFRLLWTEKDRARSEDLLDICRFEGPQRHGDYLRSLKFAHGGLGSPTLFKVDLAALPKSRQAVQVLVVIRPLFLGSSK